MWVGKRPDQVLPVQYCHVDQGTPAVNETSLGIADRIRSGNARKRERVKTRGRLWRGGGSGVGSVNARRGGWGEVTVVESRRPLVPPDRFQCPKHIEGGQRDGQRVGGINGECGFESIGITRVRRDYSSDEEAQLFKRWRVPSGNTL
jgi:hypothetical protein